MADAEMQLESKDILYKIQILPLLQFSEERPGAYCLLPAVGCEASL